MKAGTAERLIDSLGGSFSRELGINLEKADSAEIFKWFLASKLFGARISTNIAIKTYREFERRGVTTPDKILGTGWDGLVEILDEGGYVRYDFSTATKLLGIMECLVKLYGGDLNKLHRDAKDPSGLEGLLKGLGKGIGDVTVNIFLRELRTVWPKARPKLSPYVLLAAERLGLIKPGEDPLKALGKRWSGYKLKGRDFCDFEAALLRLGKDYCRKSRYELCPLKNACKCRV